MRKAAGLTQRGLAAKLGRVRTIVERIEMGERRVDVVELYWLAKACGASPGRVFAQMARALSASDSAKRRRR